MRERQDAALSRAVVGMVMLAVALLLSPTAVVQAGRLGQNELTRTAGIVLFLVSVLVGGAVLASVVAVNLADRSAGGRHRGMDRVTRWWTWCLAPRVILAGGYVAVAAWANRDSLLPLHLAECVATAALAWITVQSRNQAP